DVDAHRGDDLAVVDSRPNDGADAGAALHEGEGHADGDGQADHEDAVPGVGEVADDEGAGNPHRVGKVLRVAAEDRQAHVGDDEGHADGEEHFGHLLAAHEAQEHDLHHEGGDAHGGDRGDDGDQQVPGQGRDHDADVAAEHVEGPV